MIDKKLNDQELSDVNGGVTIVTAESITNNPVIVGSHPEIPLASDSETSETEVSNTSCMPTF